LRLIRWTRPVLGNRDPAESLSIGSQRWCCRARMQTVGSGSCPYFDGIQAGLYVLYKLACGTCTVTIYFSFPLPRRLTWLASCKPFRCLRRAMCPAILFFGALHLLGFLFHFCVCSCVFVMRHKNIMRYKIPLWKGGVLLRCI
jgi:hypothetical protein